MPFFPGIRTLAGNTKDNVQANNDKNDLFSANFFSWQYYSFNLPKNKDVISTLKFKFYSLP